MNVLLDKFIIMKRKLLYAFFLLISFLGYSQQYNYQLKITNYDFYAWSSSGRCGTNELYIEVTFDDNTKWKIYSVYPNSLKKNELINRFFIKKIKNIRFYTFIHEKAYLDCCGACNGSTSKIDKKTIDYSTSGSMSYNHNGGAARTRISFDYEITTVQKDYNYKIEYDIDLHNKSLLNRIKFDFYSGDYSLSLKTDVESKGIYFEGIRNTNDSDPLVIKNKKYDSIVRFKDPLNKVNGLTNITFKTNSLLKCVDQEDNGPRGLSVINANQNTRINESTSCISHKYLFPSCSTTKINYFNLFRIYENLGDVESNKDSFKNLEIKACEPFRIYINDCKEPSSYEVLYSTDDLNFKTLFPYARRESYFDVDYSKLEGVSLDKPIKIRVKYYKNADCNKAPYLCSKATSFTIFPCPPKLIEETESIKPIESIKTTCYYDKDGRFKINFDRKLLNEKLILTLYFKDLNGIFQVYKQEDTLILEDNLNGTYSYTWKGLNDGFLDPKEEYKVKYQTLRNINKEILANDPSWSYAEESKPFTISKAVNVVFTAIKLNDKNCFNSGYGKIKLDITKGEETRKYSYILYKIKDSKETVYRDWTEFSGKSTIIENLDKNKYRIKVKDSKECFARKP